MSKERIAAQNVLARTHFSEHSVEEEEGAAKRAWLLTFYGTGLLNQALDRPYDGGVSEQIYWLPSFVFLKALNIKSKVLSNEPLLINLYHHRKTLPYIAVAFDCFYCYTSRDQDALMSSAKIVTSLYPDHVYINAINSYEPYLGSLLIQVAVEHSLRESRGGKIKLKATRNSDEFFLKSGFLYEGELMYLPQSSIEAWKIKIAQHPVLPNKASAVNYFQFFTQAVSPYLKPITEAFNGCCKRRK
jgi:hypothetical protein